MVILKKNVYTSSCFESKSGGTTTPSFIFFTTQNVVLMKESSKGMI
jgi:hypothetical protein